MIEATRGTIERVRHRLVARIVEYLTQPLPNYERRGSNDPAVLRATVRKGDVVLVEGDQRVSAIIRYLTQSSWSHSALYIGDELLRRGGPRAEWAQRHFGDEASYLVVEALPSGVVTSPLVKYVDYNVRICRPHRLRPDDAKVLLEEATAAIGWRYDLRNVLDLARYLIPVRLVPPRWRTTALHFGSGQPTEVICSSLLAHLFAKIRFPILPTHERGEVALEAPPASAGRRLPLVSRIFGQPSREYTGIFRMRHPTLITPRDFDLSPYFDVIKFNPLGHDDFDYSRMHWAEDDGPGSGGRR